MAVFFFKQKFQSINCFFLNFETYLLDSRFLLDDYGYGFPLLAALHFDKMTNVFISIFPACRANWIQVVNTFTRDPWYTLHWAQQYFIRKEILRMHRFGIWRNRGKSKNARNLIKITLNRKHQNDIYIWEAIGRPKINNIVQ